MKHIVWVFLGVALFACGCKSVEVPATSTDLAVGRPVDAVVKAHQGQRIRYFDVDGKELKKLPEKQRGSVSIYNKDVTAQDNYVFDKKGIIDKHQRSCGEDYSNGVWREVK